MVKIATWNVNSVKARLPNLLAWLEEAQPDVALLQETKCLAENFPRMEIEAAGYKAAVVGQKSYNGVAILAKTEPEVLLEALPGDESDTQARYIEARVAGLRVATIYLPNGNPVDTEKYPYKLAWMARLRQRVQDLLPLEEAFVLGGDYNVIPRPEDCYDPRAWAEDALFRPETRNSFRSILNLGLTDAFRALHRESGAYTFWDYQRGAWENGNGIRIDHLLLSPRAADRLVKCQIDTKPRGQAKASDHTPIWCELAPEQADGTADESAVMATQATSD